MEDTPFVRLPTGENHAMTAGMGDVNTFGPGEGRRVPGSVLPDDTTAQLPRGTLTALSCTTGVNWGFSAHWRCKERRGEGEESGSGLKAELKKS
ncbi:hypothetical protein EYF80_034610 [Liparis tanakae]|uniref:Uncharacterized protein n=1 Tax=Liparis tanakae TaxID=230148 RepID=A0A4Z2GPX9_9TELE|nr:hypothetical protein EYF80_034610 [Liparis tanakae]